MVRKLHVGCGRNNKEGYDHCDIADFPHITYRTVAWNIDVPSNTYSEIYSRHFFEHLTPEQANLTLKKWKDILTNGGIIHMILPNLEYHCKQLTMPGQSKWGCWSNEEHAINSIFGWQGRGEAHRHRWGYTKKTMKELLIHHGYQNIQFIDCRECDIEVKATKV